jgi:hypothetical protein
MIALAQGKSVWGLTKDKYLATRINTVLQTVPGLTKKEKFAANPLGIITRFVNKKEAEANAVKIKAIPEQIAKDKEELFQAKKELGAMSAINFDAKRSKELLKKVSDLEAKVEGGVVGQVRIVIAESLAKGKIDSVLRKVGIKMFKDEDIEILTEQIIYGNIDSLFAEISEGASNFALGATYNETVLQLVKDLGTDVRPFKLDLTTAKKRYTKHQM